MKTTSRLTSLSLSSAEDSSRVKRFLMAGMMSLEKKGTEVAKIHAKRQKLEVYRQDGGRRRMAIVLLKRRIKWWFGRHKGQGSGVEWPLLVMVLSDCFVCAILFLCYPSPGPLLPSPLSLVESSGWGWALGCLQEQQRQGGCKMVGRKQETYTIRGPLVWVCLVVAVLD